MVWARNGTPDTLSSTADEVLISDLTSTIFNMEMCHLLASGSIQHKWRFGNGSIDTGANYAWRRSGDGGTDGTATSANELNANQSTADIFAIRYTINIAAEEKLAMAFTSEQNTAGATTAPSRMEAVGKWANTSNQFDNVNAWHDNAGDFASGSNLSVLTGDETEIVTLQDGTIFEETDTNKAYIWSSSSETWTQL